MYIFRSTCFYSFLFPFQTLSSTDSKRFFLFLLFFFSARRFQTKNEKETETTEPGFLIYSPACGSAEAAAAHACKLLEPNSRSPFSLFL